MLRQIYSVSSLIFATIFFLLGNGMFMSLLALRGRHEGFSDQSLGLMSSVYFIGFLLGGYIVPRIVRRMGHIRAFSFFAASLAIFMLLQSLLVNIQVWTIIRLFTGISIVGFYTVIESWFNGTTQPNTRAQIFAVYMMAEMFSNAAAQQLLRFASVDSFTLFAIAAILVCLAMLPITATRLSQPVVNNISHLTIRRMWKAAPIAVLGALAAGLTNGTLWTMGALYGKKLGLDTAHVATLMSTIILGGAFLQIPLGRLSDTIDRRKALALAVLGGAIAASFMFLLGNNLNQLLIAAFIYGGMVFAIYSIVIAHLMDRLEPQDMMAGSAGVLLLYGVGAIIGPSIAGILMDMEGARAFPLFFAIVLTPLFVYILINTYKKQKDEIVEQAAQFIPLLKTTVISTEIAVAIEEHRLESTSEPEEENAQHTQNNHITENPPTQTESQPPETAPTAANTPTPQTPALTPNVAPAQAPENIAAPTQPAHSNTTQDKTSG